MGSGRCQGRRLTEPAGPLQRPQICVVPPPTLNCKEGASLTATHLPERDRNWGLMPKGEGDLGGFLEVSPTASESHLPFQQSHFTVVLGTTTGVRESKGPAAVHPPCSAGGGMPVGGFVQSPTPTPTLTPAQRTSKFERAEGFPGLG